jgi:hypothetical protein
MCTIDGLDMSCSIRFGEGEVEKALREARSLPTHRGSPKQLARGGNEEQHAGGHQDGLHVSTTPQ